MRAPSLLLAALVVTLCGCIGAPEATLESDPGAPIIAASNFLHPPFSSRDAAGRPIGVEVDLIEEAARRLGRPLTWTELPFGELIPEVAAGRVDVSASTIGITDERARMIAYTEPYFETSIVALVRPSAGEPRRLEDLRGRRVVTERGTSTIGAVRARIPEAIRVLERPDERSWGELLAAGEVDAVALDRSHAPKFSADAGVEFHVIPEAIAAERFALVTRQGDDLLREALNEVIRERSVELLD